MGTDKWGLGIRDRRLGTGLTTHGDGRAMVAARSSQQQRAAVGSPFAPLGSQWPVLSTVAPVKFSVPTSLPPFSERTYVTSDQI